jgi:hypothetical protein
LSVSLCVFQRRFSRVSRSRPQPTASLCWDIVDIDLWTPAYQAMTKYLHRDSVATLAMHQILQDDPSASFARRLQVCHSCRPRLFTMVERPWPSSRSTLLATCGPLSNEDWVRKWVTSIPTRRRLANGGMRSPSMMGTSENLLGPSMGMSWKRCVGHG